MKKSWRQSRQAKYKARKPWVRFVEWARRRCACTDPEHWYKNYGAKGITCSLTANELQAVWVRDNAAAMKRPSLDRIDANRGYDLFNVRFLEFKLNSRLAWDPTAAPAPEFT